MRVSIRLHSPPLRSARSDGSGPDVNRSIQLDGRWGRPTFTQALRPVSIKDYFVVLKLLFDWLVSSGTIETSLMKTLARPPVQVERVRTLLPST